MSDTCRLAARGGHLDCLLCISVIGPLIHALLQLKEDICTVTYGLESMDVLGTKLYVGMQLKEVIWTYCYGKRA